MRRLRIRCLRRAINPEKLEFMRAVDFAVGVLRAARERKSELSLLHMEVLMAVASGNKGKASKAIAREQSVNLGLVLRMLSGLQSKGYVEQDLLRHGYMLTPKGEEVVKLILNV